MKVVECAAVRGVWGGYGRYLQWNASHLCSVQVEEQVKISHVAEEASAVLAAEVGGETGKVLQEIYTTDIIHSLRK